MRDQDDIHRSLGNNPIHCGLDGNRIEKPSLHQMNIRLRAPNVEIGCNPFDPACITPD